MALESRRKLSVLSKLIVACSVCVLFSHGCTSLSERFPSSKGKYTKTAKSVKYKKYTKTSARKTSSSAYTKPYKVFGKWYYPMAHARGFRQRGIASWYGEEFHGKRTSSGEVFDMYNISAAHKILPLGTYVRVRNLENGRELDLMVNDRGPFIPGRIIDLSKAAAIALGVYGPGTADVEIVALGIADQLASKNRTYIPVDYYSGNFRIQVGAFRDRNNAEKLRSELRLFYGIAQVQPYYNRRGGELLYRVLVGKCSDLNQAEQYESLLKTKGFYDAFTVAD